MASLGRLLSAQIRPVFAQSKPYAATSFLGSQSAGGDRRSPIRYDDGASLDLAVVK